MFDSLQIVAIVEIIQVEPFSGLDSPQGQQIDRIVVISRHRRLVGNRQHILRIHPIHPVISLFTGIGNGAPIKADGLHTSQPRRFPGISTKQPVIRFFHLLPVFNFLVKDAVLISNAVSFGRYRHGGHGIQETGRQTAKTPIAQPRVEFLFIHIFKHHPQPVNRLPRTLFHVQVQHGVLKRPAHEKFQGKVVHPLSIRRLVPFLGFQPSVHETCSNRDGQALVFFIGRGVFHFPAQGKTHGRKAGGFQGIPDQIFCHTLFLYLSRVHGARGFLMLLFFLLNLMIAIINMKLDKGPHIRYSN